LKYQDIKNLFKELFNPQSFHMTEKDYVDIPDWMLEEEITSFTLRNYLSTELNCPTRCSWDNHWDT